MKTAKDCAFFFFFANVGQNFKNSALGRLLRTFWQSPGIHRVQASTKSLKENTNLVAQQVKNERNTKRIVSPPTHDQVQAEASTVGVPQEENKTRTGARHLARGLQKEHKHV